MVVKPKIMGLFCWFQFSLKGGGNMVEEWLEYHPANLSVVGLDLMPIYFIGMFSWRVTPLLYVSAQSINKLHPLNEGWLLKREI